MLKYVQHHFDTIAGIGIYPMLSFVVFFTFFLAMLWWVLKVSRRHIDHMAALPLHDGSTSNDELHAH